MAIDLQAVHRALAGQISEHITRDTNVAAFPDGSYSPPQITVHSDPGGYLNYAMTFNDEADLMLRLKLEVEAGDDLESVCIKVTDYLSSGTGNTSSIIDAVNFDRTLGGAVENCRILTAEWDTDTNPAVAWLPVVIYLDRE